LIKSIVDHISTPLPSLYRKSSVLRDFMMLAIALFLHLYLIHLATATCYYPDDSVTPEDVSCRYTGNSSCCSIGWICLSNGLCQNPSPTINDHGGGKYYRGSCTDPTFDSPNCAAVCLKPGVDTLNDAAEIVWCNTSGGSDYFYCYHPSDTTVPDCSVGTSDTRIIQLPGTIDCRPVSENSH
jgi:hypothetical protein